MKKIALISLLGILLVFGVLPLAISAQGEVPTQCTMSKNVGITGCPGIGGVCVYSTTPLCGVCCLMNTIYSIIDWIFVFLLAIAVIMIIMGAFSFVTAGGDPEKTMKARNYIMYAAIGIAVALLAKAVPAMVKMIVGA